MNYHYRQKWNELPFERRCAIVESQSTPDKEVHRMYAFFARRKKSARALAARIVEHAKQRRGAA